MDTALDCGKVEALLFQVRMSFLTININIYAELKKPCQLVRYGNLRASFPRLARLLFVLGRSKSAVESLDHGEFCTNRVFLMGPCRYCIFGCWLFGKSHHQFKLLVVPCQLSKTPP